MDSRMRLLGQTVVLAAIVAVGVAFGMTAARAGAEESSATEGEVPVASAADEKPSESAVGTATGGAATEAAAPETAAPTAAAEGVVEEAAVPEVTGEEPAGASVTSAEKPAEEKREPAGMSAGSIQLLVFMALLAMLMLISYRGPKSRASR